MLLTNCSSKHARSIHKLNYISHKKLQLYDDALEGCPCTHRTLHRFQWIERREQHIAQLANHTRDHTPTAARLKSGRGGPLHTNMHIQK